MTKKLNDILAEAEERDNSNKGVARWVGGPEAKRTKERLKREKQDAEDRGAEELAGARRKDFDDAEQANKEDQVAKRVKRAARKKNLKEYLEDGTDELVKAYRDNVPEQ